MFVRLTPSARYGEKISIVWDSSILAAGYAGNPIIVDSPFSLSLFAHEISHDFTGACAPLPATVSEAIANILPYYLSSVQNITSVNLLMEPLDISRYKTEWLAVLSDYEEKGSNFETLDLGYWGQDFFAGIMCHLVDSYGWQTLSRLNFYSEKNKHIARAILFLFNNALQVPL